MNPKINLIEAAKAAHAARLAAQAAATSAANSTIVAASSVALALSNTTQHAQTSAMSFNPEQLAAIELGLQGKSFCLIGAAGTGKTTVTQELISRVQQASHMRPLEFATKHLAKDAPGIVICGFTNKAVNNIRKKLPKHLQSHCITLHKLLEYAPNYYEVPDNEGGMRTTMRFGPSFNRTTKLPHISTLILEESSMIGTDLYAEVINALPNPSATQIIFLGDLNQIPPVFGPSILGFKLSELATIELTHVYRQALESPIINLATDIRLNKQAAIPTLSGEPVIINKGEHGKLTIKPWKKRVAGESALAMMKVFLPRIIESGEYDPEVDMILCPFNKSFGTIELNNIIADYLGKKRDAEVFEIIARYQKSYFAVGDRILVDRHEATILEIKPAMGYGGKLPRMSSKTLDRWGVDPNSDEPPDLTADEVLNMLDTLGGGDDDSTNRASHTMLVRIEDTGEERLLTNAGEINSIIFGYALTVHKSQGSEWPRVFVFLHNTHATMLSRELLYTAVTRAKQELYIVCEGDIKPYENSIKRAAARAIIPGTLLAEKIEFFKGKAASMASMASSDT